MNCPTCEASAKCINTRQQGARRYRRYECSQGHKFTTRELHESELLELGGAISQEDIIRAVAGALPDLIDAIAKRLATAKDKSTGG